MGTGHRAVMHEFRSFLESSTIHGLTYISSTRKYVRLFWIFVVITGFSAASFMIYESFQAWEESPVSTNIETLPITEITFPKVTVCPPKDTYTDLNYDLMMTENMNISNEVRNNLLNYARNLLKDHLHHVVMTNFSKISEDNLYRKWYQGYTKIQGPHWSDHYNINFHWDSYATSGTIKTENFGKKFDIDKVDPDIMYQITIHPPQSVKSIGSCSDITLHFDLKKNSMRNVLSGYERYSYSYNGAQGSNIEAQEKTVTQDYCPPSEKRELYLRRKVSMEDVKKMPLMQMPGFQLKWHYTWGSDGEVLPDAKLLLDGENATKMFVRT